MFYILIIFNFALFPIGVLALLLIIIDKLTKKEENEKVAYRTKRIHPTIQKNNYENAFGGKKAYEIYKNKNGLYEPVIPSKGIKLGEEDT